MAYVQKMAQQQKIVISDHRLILDLLSFHFVGHIVNCKMRLSGAEMKNLKASDISQILQRQSRILSISFISANNVSKFVSTGSFYIRYLSVVENRLNYTKRVSLKRDVSRPQPHLVIHLCKSISYQISKNPCIVLTT